MEADPRKLVWTDAYRILIGSIVPRPIGWVSSVSVEGIRNLAPFSFFNGVCASPMIVSFAPMRFNSGSKKDTLSNVEATGEFVVNVVTEDLLAAMDATSAEFPTDVDEFGQVGLTPAPSVAVRPPRVAESPINFECKVVDVLHFGSGPGSGALVVGEVVHLHVGDEVLLRGRVDVGLLKPVARMGGALYSRPELLEYERRRFTGER